MFDDVSIFQDVSKSHNGVAGVYRIVFDCGSEYIGSSTNLAARWYSHKNTIKSGRHANRQIQDLSDSGLTPKCQVMMVCEPEKVRAFEQIAIDQRSPSLNRYAAIGEQAEFAGFGKRWFAMAQDPALAMAERGRELGRDGLMVYMFLLGSLDYENEIAVSQAEIGNHIGLAKQHVSRAIKRLVDMGAIQEGRKFGNMKSYRLHPSFGWKGKGSNHIKALQEI